MWDLTLELSASNGGEEKEWRVMGAELKNIMLDCFLLRQATHMLI
jgi:hypothetical protein